MLLYARRYKEIWYFDNNEKKNLKFDLKNLFFLDEKSYFAMQITCIISDKKCEKVGQNHFFTI